MAHVGFKTGKALPPDETGQESAFLKYLSESRRDVKVKMLDGELVAGWIEYYDKHMVRLTREGQDFFECAGIDVGGLDSGRRPLCRPCLDWSERRSHLGGTLGAAILDHVVARRWAVREPKSRVVRFTPSGEQKMTAWFSR